MALEKKSKALSDVQAIIDYHCQDTDFLWEALQACGTHCDCTGMPTPPDGNKRLAVVGDAALKLALMEDWYHTGLVKGCRCSGLSSVQLSLTLSAEQADKIMHEVATNVRLDQTGKLFGLDRFVNIVGTGQTTVNWRAMAATVEGILGAVFLDGGLAATKRVMRALSLVPAV